jgi:hypothetical protein
MSNNYNINILNRIFNNIEKFRAKEISAEDMVANLSANITALEGVSSEFIDNFQCFLGEIDFIKYTETSTSGDELILKEVNEYSDYLKKYFKY